MIKKIRGWFKRKRATHDMPAMSEQDLIQAQIFLKWLISDQPSIYFRLNQKEIEFFKENYIIPWQEKNYDDSFFDWDLATPYLELNYLLQCFHGQHGFIKSQDAFEYVCKIHPHLLDFHQEMAKENILCGPSKQLRK